LAAVVGHYAWAEHRIFELAGAWAAAPGPGPDPEVRVWCAAASRRHGELAARWRERLPVRAGVDPAALVTPPEGRLAEVLDTLASEADPLLGPAGLVLVVLPTMAEAYAGDLASATPVAEAPVMEVLVGAHRVCGAEIRSGKGLLARVGAPPRGAGEATGGGLPLIRHLEQMFGNLGDVFPAEWPA
jgi:hypothetical protein